MLKTFQMPLVKSLFNCLFINELRSGISMLMVQRRRPYMGPILSKFHVKHLQANKMTASFSFARRCFTLAD